ncbi:MAG: FHA domain-containing protein [Pseudomonadota bacterium]
MNGPYFIESLARNGDVLHRHQVDQLPIRLGRGYDNDFILDDDHVAPHHALIEAAEGGVLLLRDLGSRNGVIHLGKRKTSLALSGDTVIRMGHTNLRVRGADYPVPPELVDRTMHGWEGAVPGIVGLLLIGMFALLTFWLSDTQSFQLARYLQVLANVAGAALVWSGAWAFANRLFGRHARLGRHLFIVGCALMAITAYKLVSSVLAYAFSLDWITRYGSHVAILVGAGALFYHLRTVKPHHARRFAITCLSLAMLGSGLKLISNEQGSGRLADDLYMSVLLPPSMRASPDHSVDEFMGRVNSLRARLDAERTKKVKDGGGENEDD